MSNSDNVLIVRNDPDILRFVCRPGSDYDKPYVIDWDGKSVCVNTRSGKIWSRLVDCRVCVSWATHWGSGGSGCRSLPVGETVHVPCLSDTEVTVTMTKLITGPSLPFLFCNMTAATSEPPPPVTQASQHVLRDMSQLTTIRDSMAAVSLPDIPTAAELMKKKELLDQVLAEALTGVEGCAELQQLKEVKETASATIEKWMPWAKLRDVMVAEAGEEAVQLNLEKLVEGVGEKGWERV